MRTGKRRFLLFLAAPTVVAVLAACLAMVAMLFVSARSANEAAFDRQFQLAQHVLNQSIERIPYEQESITVWDDPVLKLREPDLDYQWLDDNVGIWMHSYFGHDEVYVVDASGHPVYAMRDGERADPTSFEQLGVAAAPLIAQVRNQPDALPEGKALTRGAADLVIIKNRPAFVSVKPIVSSTGTIEQQPGTEHLHISVRFLDRTFITELAEAYMFERPRFSWTDTRAGTERALPLVSAAGRPIGYFVWQPYEPGSSVLRNLLPVLIGALLIISLVVAALMMRVRRGAAELQASEAQAHHLAFHDTLTGLPNRALFDDRLERQLSEARRSTERKIALHYIDLDRFKFVNDTLGHPAGDELIRELARRLTRTVRDCDTVARIGGDEFAIIQTGITSVADAERLCERILQTVRAPVDVLGTQVFFGVSVGVALAPADAVDKIELTRKADIALYRAKAAGRGRHAIFNDDMDASIRQRRMIERDLRAALRTGEQLEIYYQPLYAADTKNVTGVEALVRWRHPVDGIRSPAIFIPVAEESGLIELLGDWVLKQASSTAARWPIEKLAVNVSAVQLRNPKFASRVLEILAETGLEADRLELEITETALMESAEQCEPNIRALRAAGVRIALDDFGTGYSSLSHLHHFQVDRVKIDRSFVNTVSHDQDTNPIIQAIVDLAKATGLKVTAEGVETEEQSKFLSGIGCNELQGYLLSRPVPEGDIDELVGVERPKSERSEVAAAA